jgi:hypothetical protein
VCRASIADAGYYVIDDDGEGTFTVDYDLLVVDTAKTLEDAKRLAEEHWNSWAEIARGEAASFEQIVTDIDQSARIEELEAENAHLREQFAALAVPKHSRKDDTLVDQVNKWHCEPVRFFKGYEARFTEWHEGKSLDDDAAASLASSFRETGNGFHRLVDLLFPPPAPDDAPPPDPAQEQPAVDTGSSMRPVKAPKGMNKQDWMRRQSALAAESATTPPPATEPEPAESKAIDLDLPEFLRRTPAKPAPAPPGPAPAEEPDPAVVDAGLAWHQVKKDWFWVGHVGDADHTYALVVVPTRFYVPGGWRIIADYATDTERDLGFERTLDWAKQRAERDWLKSVKTWHPWWGYDVDPAFRNMVSKVKNWDDDTAPVSAPKRTKKPEPVA